MRMGFTFNGRHSGEFGITMKTASRPVQPEVKGYKYDSPLMDGMYDFSTANGFGRAFYKNRLFVLNLMLFADNISELQQKISAVSLWLCGSGELIFDDMPLIKWRACVMNGIDYAPERKGKKAILSVTFDVEPFSYAVFMPENVILIEDEIPICAPVLLDMGDVFVYTVNPESGSLPVLEIINTGTWYVSPKFSMNVSGCGGVSISCGGKKLTVIGDHGAAESFDVVIDFKNKTVTYTNGRDITCNAEGEFFELMPGVNEVTVETLWDEGAEAQAYNLNVEYEPKYMYDFDYTVWEGFCNA